MSQSHTQCWGGRRGQTHFTPLGRRSFLMASYRRGSSIICREQFRVYYLANGFLRPWNVSILEMNAKAKPEKCFEVGNVIDFFFGSGIFLSWKLFSRLKIITFVVAYIGSTAIMCYHCNSAYDPRCADPFNSFSIGMINCSTQKPPDHLTDKDLQPTLCRKTTQKGLLKKTFDKAKN